MDNRKRQKEIKEWRDKKDYEIKYGIKKFDDRDDWELHYHFKDK